MDSVVLINEQFNDPAHHLAGHVDNDAAPVYQCRRELHLFDPITKRPARERIVEDQWGNLYCLYDAKIGHDTYDVSIWVRPSDQMMHGGFTDALLDLYRKKAFDAFQRAALITSRGN